MNKFISLFCAGALALTVVGCATVNTIEPADQRTHPNLVPDKRIITNSHLNSIAYASQVTESKIGDLLHVQVMLQNMTVAARNVDYRFQWYDGAGMAVGTPVEHTAFLEGGQTIPIGETATSPQAVTWQLTLAESVAQSPDLNNGAPVRSGR